jgi:NAD(P)H-dependent flavin oxidoreductase YrpB (nitropropane dioxygenase family)
MLSQCPLYLRKRTKPPAVMLSFGEVQPHAQRIKRAGALLICQIQTLGQVKEALANDVDILVAQGAEGGGHGISRSTVFQSFLLITRSILKPVWRWPGSPHLALQCRP